MENKLSTLGMFLVIEEASDKTTVTSMGLALQEYDVSPILSRWVTGMLRNREVLINVGGTEIEAVVDRVCPQGEVFPLYCGTLSLSASSHFADRKKRRDIM